jgi:hypothetical protein
MPIFTIALVVIFSFFSTAVMSYISMATPIGPWIAPTITLLSLLIFKLFSVKNPTRSLVLVTTASSIGGIVATACGFSYPTLFFLDPILFNSWMESPGYFAMIMTGISFSAGSFGLVFANVFEKQLIEKQELPFPIGQLVYKMIAASTHIKKAYELMAGFVGTTLFCILQDGISTFTGFIPRLYVLVDEFQWSVFMVPRVEFMMWPMLWAIGFVTGHVIAIPLAVGALAKVILVDPVNQLYFDGLTNVEFVLAFASGMVVHGAVTGFMSLRGTLHSSVGWMRHNVLRGNFHKIDTSTYSLEAFRSHSGLAVPVISSVILFTYFQMPFASQLFVLLGAFACTYQIAVIAGKIGLAPLGRFATFVMIPAMLIFNVNYIHIVFIATFIEVAGGVAADILFGRKVAYLAQVDRKQVIAFQWLGLVVSSLAIGGIFWLLINQFELGSPELFAYKAQSRRLLISAKAFDFGVLIIGALFSALLGRMKINPMLVLGGLLMPINISLGLIFGGFLTWFTKNRDEWEPLWSGVFAANSLWMIIKALF